MVYTAIQANVARNAFRDGSTIHYTTIVEPNLLWDSSFVSKARKRETKKNGRSHCSGAQYVAGSHSCPALCALKQVDAREGNCRQIATGWVVERSKTTYETFGEGSL